MLHNFVFVLFLNKFKIRSTVGPIRRLMLLVQCRRHRHHCDPIKKKRKNNFSVEFLRSIFKVVCSCHLVDDAIRCQLQLIFTQIKKTKIAGQQKRKTTRNTNHFKPSLDISLLSNTHGQIKIWFVCFVWQFFGGNEEIVKCFFLFF